MDICLPELAQIDDEPAQITAEQLLSDMWITLWAKSNEHQESEKAAHSLCAALPLVTSEEARLN